MMKNFSLHATFILALLTAPFSHGMELTKQKNDNPSLCDLKEKLVNIKYNGLEERQKTMLHRIIIFKPIHLNNLASTINNNLIKNSHTIFNQFVKENKKQWEYHTSRKNKSIVLSITNLSLAGISYNIYPRTATVLGGFSLYFFMYAIEQDLLCSKLDPVKFSHNPENFIQYANVIKEFVPEDQQERINLLEEIKESKKEVTTIQKTLKNFNN